jgi:chromosome segregation ATPase
LILAECCGRTGTTEMSDSLVLAALTRLEAGQTRLEAGQARLEVGQTQLEAGLSQLDVKLSQLEPRLGQLEAELGRLKAEQKSLRSDLLAELGRTRSDIMERVERLENAVTLIRDDIAVNMGAVEAVERANDNTRADVRSLHEQMSIMWKQIKRLQTEMREIKGEP